MEKINLNDTVKDIILKMSEGNIGAIKCLTEMIMYGEKIDPQGSMGGLGMILFLDTLGMYGQDIYIIYSDQCNREVREVMMLLRAVQMGFLEKEIVKEMVSCQTREKLIPQILMDNLNTKVCDALDQFQKRQN